MKKFKIVEQLELVRGEYDLAITRFGQHFYCSNWKKYRELDPAVDAPEQIQEGPAVPARLFLIPRRDGFTVYPFFDTVNITPKHYRRDRTHRPARIKKRMLPNVAQVRRRSR
ncbi:hypothetical protein [Microcoleus sp. B4-D4]|uniref:hypothetical protein n=1 Tax=Microcoleus sp. B4-D4 TaxID=2818667 RepID=UPI002FD5264C